MKLAVKTAVVGAVLASTAVLAAPGAASADPKDGAVTRCSEGKICLFDGHDNTGDVLQLDPVDIPNIGWAWNDRASSVWNRSGGQACIHTDDDFRGYKFSIPPGEKQELLFLYDNAVTGVEVGGCSI
ncbi:MAG TPA: peptidase inhibitor family I36 protein [Streptomyces sp.]|uniref:peptidase inhibitor family I36 protein n=1 Tax=Streptomyces sp. TaxID=1931 RepID=UPI002BB6C985|nr:peptidase inhibitor family I36 protein [Streptomyces sp.]HWU09121.1 peptidase inhibitor family I36 protein [Streptomyces sp.]